MRSLARPVALDRGGNWTCDRMGQSRGHWQRSDRWGAAVR